MDLLLGLGSLVSLSLFLSRQFKLPSALTPIVSVSACMMWFTLTGVLGILRIGGFFWYIFCSLALVWTILWERRRIWRLFSPGLIFFIAGSALFIGLFAVTRPMLTQWDEFTFWGTAAKVVTTSGELYTTAASNLIARTYPPGLIVFNYMMQFFGGGFSEYKFIAAFAVVYIACFAVPAALWRKNRTGAMVFLGGMLLLPFLFDIYQPGNTSTVYLACMADLPMAAMFGGALCLYYSAPEKNQNLLFSLSIVLAALANLKDMGLALACIVAAVVTMDLLVCEYNEFRFLKLSRWKAVLSACFMQFAAIAASYGIWALHLNYGMGTNRTNLGSGGGQFSALTMLSSGIKALLRIAPDPVFDDRAAKMGNALLNRPVWLLGSGVTVFIAIFFILAITWTLSTTKHRQRRVMAFAVSMAVCFVAFYIFNLFTYTYILKGGESETLKDYHRYIFPFWFGWFMSSMAQLALPANRVPASARRARTARAVSLAVVLFILVSTGTRVNRQANFTFVSPSQYSTRLDVQQVVQTAQKQGMQPEDVVYLVSQGDDATRFYLFSYEMDAKLVPVYGGEEKPGGTTAAALVAPGTPPAQIGWTEWAYGSPEQLIEYLSETGCTHVLLDVTDEYILSSLSPYTADRFSGWGEDGLYEGGLRYYRIDYSGKEPLLVPVQGGA